MQMFPAFHSALDDARTKGAARDVYLYLSKNLDFVSYRPVKASVVAHDAKLKEITAAWALRQLCALGYLERGPSKVDRLCTYRLVWSLAAPINDKVG